MKVGIFKELDSFKHFQRAGQQRLNRGLVSHSQYPTGLVASIEIIAISQHNISLNSLKASSYKSVKVYEGAKLLSISM